MAGFPRLRWAWEQVRPRLGQLALVICVVAIGVGLSGGVLLANRTLQAAFEASADGLAGEADIVVTPATSHGALDEGLPARIEEVPGVTATAPVLVGTAFGPGRATVRIIGVDMLHEGTVRVYRSAGGNILEDPLIFLNQPGSILVPRVALDRFGLEKGSTLEVETAAGSQTLTVRGVLHDDGVALAFAGNLAVMDLYSAQDVLGVDGISRVDVRVAEGTPVDDVVNELRQRLLGLRVQRAEDETRDVVNTVATFALFFNAITFVGLLLGAVITANRLATVYEARELEIGVLRSQGMPPREVLARLLTEAAVVSTLGAGLGVVMSVVFSQILVGPLTVGLAAASRQEIPTTAVEIHAVPLLLAGAAGFFSGLIAAFLPAYRASHRDIVEVLAHGRSRDPGPESLLALRLRTWFPLGAVASLAVLLVVPSAGLGWLAVVIVGVAGFVLIPPALRLATYLVGSAIGGPATLGLDDQSVVPGRARGAVAVLMFGGAMVVLIGSLGPSMEEYIMAATMPPRQGDLVVDANVGVLSTGEGEPRISEEITARLAVMPGVRFAAAGASSSVEDPPTGIWAIDPDWLRTPELGDMGLVGEYPEDALERVARGEGVLANFPPSRPVSVGDTVTVMTPSGPLALPVISLSTVLSIHPNGNILMSREVYRKWWRDRTVHHVHLLVDDGESAAKVADRIRDALAEEYELRVLTPESLNEWLRASIRQALVIGDAIAVLTLLVVLLGTADALAANVHERTREIGALRALGCSPALARRMVLVQALGIGLAGAALGILVGLGWSVAYVYGVFPSLTGWVVDLYLPSFVLVLATMLGLAACFCGALIPASHAGRIRVVEALRYE